MSGKFSAGGSLTRRNVARDVDDDQDDGPVPRDRKWSTGSHDVTATLCTVAVGAMSNAVLVGAMESADVSSTVLRRALTPQTTVYKPQDRTPACSIKPIDVVSDIVRVLPVAQPAFLFQHRYENVQIVKKRKKRDFVRYKRLKTLNKNVANNISLNAHT